MKITVIGTGYVGLVGGTCFAETGNNVICIDIDNEKVNKLQNGETTIYEPGLDVLIQKNLKQERLQFTTDLKKGVEHAEIIFLALPTPPNEDGSADLSYILKVAEDLSNIIQSYKIIVNKSTVPVGTAEKVSHVLGKKLDKSLFDVVSNPEFLKEGMAINDFFKPDRIVIGTRSEKVKEYMKELYEPFVRQGNPIYIMDEKSAEMTKYAANSILATKISFMNEIANLCELVGASVDQVRKGIGSDSRIGRKFLFPGIGFGGSCFPKDVRALVKTADENKYDFKILKSVIQVNTRQKLVLIPKLKAYFNGKLENKTIAFWGLSFKPNTDDIREASALQMIDVLLSENCNIKVFDPEAMENTKRKYGNKLSYGTDPYDALIGADVLVIATEWSVFRSPSFEVIKKLLNHPAIFDGRNLFDTVRMKDLGFHYESIGRPINNSC